MIQETKVDGLHAFIAARFRQAGLALACFSGIAAAPAAALPNLEVLAEGVQDWVVVDDLFDARSIAPTTLDLALNDLTDPEWFNVESITVLRAPSHGRLVREPLRRAIPLRGRPGVRGAG